MLGIAHTLLVEDLHDTEFLARCCTGFDRLAAYLLGESDGIAKDAEWALRHFRNARRIHPRPRPPDGVAGAR